MTLDEALLDAAATFGQLHRDITNRRLGGQGRVTVRAIEWIDRVAYDKKHRELLLAAFLGERIDP